MQKIKFNDYYKHNNVYYEKLPSSFSPVQFEYVTVYKNGVYKEVRDKELINKLNKFEELFPQPEPVADDQLW